MSTNRGVDSCRANDRLAAARHRHPRRGDDNGRGDGGAAANESNQRGNGPHRSRYPTNAAIDEQAVHPPLGRHKVPEEQRR